MRVILSRDESGCDSHLTQTDEVGGLESEHCQPRHTINGEFQIAWPMGSSQKNVDKHDHA